MTYSLETRADTLKKTRQMLEASKMKILRKIVCKIKLDRIRSQQIRDFNPLMSGCKEDEKGEENILKEGKTMYMIKDKVVPTKLI